MNPVDYLIIAIVAVIIGGAALYIYQAKKRGAKCIGCPDSGTCSGQCSGNCSGCSGACGASKKK